MSHWLDWSPAESPETVTTPAGDPALHGLQFGLDFVCGSKSEPKSPNPANRFEEKQIFEKVVPNMDCFARLQSRHLNIF